MCTFYSATNTGIPTLNSKILIFNFNYINKNRAWYQHQHVLTGGGFVIRSSGVVTPQFRANCEGTGALSCDRCKFQL